MTLIVSDTSPLRALHHLDLLELLRTLYQDVLIPDAVADELLHPPPGRAIVDVSGLVYVEVRSIAVPDELGPSLRDLDPGESEALALALHVGAEAVLIDEREGRNVAERLGLRPIGVLGVLIAARQEGLIPAVGPLIDRLRDEINFFISESLRARVLRLSGEDAGETEP